MKIKMTFDIQIFKQEKVFIAYSKEYDISGYGLTKDKAIKAFYISVSIILNHSKPKKKLIAK